MKGYAPSRKNPNLCDICVEKGPEGGFETEGAVLFGDVRGFTSFAEEAGAQAAAAMMGRFYAAATEALLRRDAIIDKLIGDEVMALFWPPLMGGGHHDPLPPERFLPLVVEAGEDLLRRVGYGTEEGPWVPVGVGIHVGTAYVGNLGPSDVRDFTAIGDVVNTASRLQAAAEPGQIVMSERVYEAVEDRYPDAAPVELALKGKRDPFPARVLEIGARVEAGV